MKCEFVSTENFRNIETCRVEFSPGVNILLGDNAQGKTNLLEAVYFAAIGKSFRGAHESDFLRFDSKSAKVELGFADSLRSQRIEMEFSRDKSRRVSKNGVKITRMSELIGLFRAVLFCPEHLNIIKEGPAMRRQYLDVAISQLRPMYMHSLQRYNHILAQRNKLVRGAQLPGGREIYEATAEMWSRSLAHEAAALTGARLRYLDAVENELLRCFAEMTDGRETPGVRYISSAKIEEAILRDSAACETAYFEALARDPEREIALGSTPIGVHKDDIEITINGRNARQFASQGQQRSLALALKLAEGAISCRDSGEEPVFLLDDVFSELDAGRRAYLAERMRRGQIILTTCTERVGDGGAEYLGANIIKVAAGSFLPLREGDKCTLT